MASALDITKEIPIQPTWLTASQAEPVESVDFLRPDVELVDNSEAPIRKPGNLAWLAMAGSAIAVAALAYAVTPKPQIVSPTTSEPVSIHQEITTSTMPASTTVVAPSATPQPQTTTKASQPNQQTKTFIARPTTTPSAPLKTTPSTSRLTTTTTPIASTTAKTTTIEPTTEIVTLPPSTPPSIRP